MDEPDFGEDYFLHDCGRPYQRDQHFLQFFGRIADTIVYCAGFRTIVLIRTHTNRMRQNQLRSMFRMVWSASAS